ncbi:collagen-binding domain-containing protein, partial [Vagococcus sp.]|uniref:collagen-binding domain-containing protein n=1 Tax=Vagococcus sp. TaxID=1933889 RepID=UPI002FCCB664
MKLSKKIIFSFIGIVLMLVLTTTGYSFFEDVYLIKDGETFYKDVPEAKSSPLGAANYFHIFANKANLRNHTNGNVATRELSGDSNFGTQNIQEMEYNYAQQVKNINGASGITGHTKMVFGKDVRIDLSEFNRPKVNGKQMDRISGNDIYQDKAPNVYIDFDAEFQKLNNVSKSIIDHEVDRTYSSADFPDRNIRVIDASEFNKKDVYIKLTSDVLQTGTPVTIAGLEKNSGDGQFKNVYITVDTGNQSSYTMDSQIKFRYTDGSERGNKETIDFSDSTVLWNFEQYGSPFSGSINLRSTWVGSMLAPKASVGGEQNIDGNIIANEFRGAGETHSWHWQKNKGGVVLEKTDSEDGAFLSGAEFSLYNAETKKLVK